MPRKVFDINPSSRKKANTPPEQDSEAVFVPVHETPEPVKKTRTRKPKAIQFAEESLSHEDTKTALLETFFAEKKEIEKENPAEKIKQAHGKKPRPGRFRRPVLTIVAVALVAGLVYAAGLSVASVHIILKTQKDAQDQNFSVALSTTASASSTNMLPLQMFKKTFTYSKTYQTTGTSTQDIYVQGALTVYNEAQQTPQILIAGTRFVSSGGKTFRIAQRIVVPGYTLVNGTVAPGTISVNVKADRPGSSYAVDASRFTLPGLQGTAKYTKIYGVSINAFSYDPSNAHSVSANDILEAKQDIAQYAFDQAKADIVKTLPDSIKLFDQALQIRVTNVSVNVAPGDSATSFHASITGSLALMAFDERDIARFVALRMPQFSIHSDLVSPVYRFSYENPQVDFSKGEMSLTVHARREVTVLLDNLSLRQRVSGKSLAQLRSDLLAIPGLDQVQLSVWPFWVWRVPMNIDKITVEVQ